MKKFFAFAVAVMLTATSFAQTETGRFFFAPKVGYNAASLTSAPKDYTRQLGLVAGIEVGYQMTDKFGITADVLYSGQGIDCDTRWFEPDGITPLYRLKDDTKLDYLNIPILANYYIVKGLAVKAGIQPGFLVSSKRKFERDIFDGTGLKTGENDLKDGLNSFDFSIPVGLSYEWKNIIIDARYIIGISNVNKSNKPLFEEVPLNEFGKADPRPMDKSSKNGVFQLTLGYKLPF